MRFGTFCWLWQSTCLYSPLRVHLVSRERTWTPIAAKAVYGHLLKTSIELKAQ